MNWIDLTVGEFCPFTYGKSLPDSKREQGTIPVYGSNGIVGFHNTACVSGSGVIIGRKGSVGFVHFSEQDFWPIDTTFYVDKGTESENRFCYYLLSTLGLQGMNFDAAVPGLNRNNAHALEIRIPDLEKDRKTLIEPLKTLDDKIALNRKLNETLEGMARALFQSWFVDFDPVKAKFAAKKVLRARQQTPSPQTPLPEGEGLIEEEHPYVTKACMAALSGKLRILPGRPKLGTPTSPSASVKEKADGDVGAPRGLPTADELDAAIAALDSLSPSQQENLAQTAAHFPAAFQESELGLVPEGWEVGTLGDHASFQNGYAFKSKDWTSEGIPVVKIGSVKPRIVDLSGCSFVSNKTVVGLERFELNAGDILVGMTGYPGETGLVPVSDPKPFLNQRVGRISPPVDSQENYAWIFALVRDLEFKIFVEGQAHGSAQANVSGKAILNYPIVWSNVSTIDKFREQVEPLIKSILANEHQSRTLAELRDTLLPKLLSGELSVGDASNTVEAAVES